MRPPKKYIVVETREYGGIEVYPMKAWCRDHFDEAPPMNPSETNSQQLRTGFRQQGWRIDETDTQVRLYRLAVVLTLTHPEQRPLIRIGQSYLY
jgi:hypothetical protein